MIRCCKGDTCSSGSAATDGGSNVFDTGGFSTASEANGHTEPDGYTNLSYNGRIDYASAGGLVARGFIRGFDTDLDFDPPLRAEHLHPVEGVENTLRIQAQRRSGCAAGRLRSSSSGCRAC